MSAEAQQLSPHARRFTYRTSMGGDAEVYAAEVNFEPAHVVFRTAGGAIVLAETNANVNRLTEQPDDGTPLPLAAYPASRRHRPGDRKR